MFECKRLITDFMYACDIDNLFLFHWIWKEGLLQVTYFVANYIIIKVRNIEKTSLVSPSHIYTPLTKLTTMITFEINKFWRCLQNHLTY